jgi:hypothetical protein
LGRVLGVVMDTKISGEGGMILGKCLWCLCEGAMGMVRTWDREFESMLCYHKMHADIWRGV